MRESVSLIMVSGLLHIAERVPSDNPGRGPPSLDWEQFYGMWPEYLRHRLSRLLAYNWEWARPYLN
jgi:hypothetical protein